MILQCQRDAYQRSGEFVVTNISERDDRTWIELEDTVLYPEGGGQPSDHGTLAGARVERVERRDGRAQHLLVLNSRDSFATGERVRVEVDWVRRFDFMQQHTAQHLITAIAEDHFDWATTSFHLGDAYSAIELDTPFITERSLTELNDRVNEAIRGAHALRARIVSPDEYQTMNLRSRGLAEGVDAAIRLVEIEGIDLNTCGGTHVDNLAELQVIHFLKTEPARGGTRLHFLAGSRSIEWMRSAHERTVELSETLSCGADDQVSAVLRQQVESRAHRRAYGELQTRFADLLGRSLASRGDLLAHRIESGDLGMLEAIARAYESARPGGRIVLLSDEGIFLLAGPADWTPQAGKTVAATLEGRGGGRPGRYQGRASKIDAFSLAAETLNAELVELS